MSLLPVKSDFICLFLSLALFLSHLLSLPLCSTLTITPSHSPNPPSFTTSFSVSPCPSSPHLLSLLPPLSPALPLSLCRNLMMLPFPWPPRPPHSPHTKLRKASRRYCSAPTLCCAVSVHCAVVVLFPVLSLCGVLTLCPVLCHLCALCFPCVP